MAANRQVLLKSRPSGMPTPENFEIVVHPVPEPAEGEVLVHNRFLSVDPYMRGRMNDAKSYATPVAIGGVMGGGAVGEVVTTRDARFQPGDAVVGPGLWQDYAVLPAKALRKLDPALAPISTALGVLGMPGHTAYVGMLDIGQPKAGETAVVSAATGAVGAVAGQIAKLKGARLVGIAGGADKCRYAVEALGFDACIDHRAPDLRDRLAQACPAGVDVYFENVGGAVLEAVWPLLNTHARMPVCGLIAQYNDAVPRPGPDLRSVLSKRITMRGFIISDHADRFAAFLGDTARWVRDGKVKYREDVVDGLEQAPAGLIGLLEGRNFGKLLVRLAT